MKPLLPLTKIERHEDVHDMIERLQEPAGSVLVKHLGYSRGDAAMFMMIVSELAQNVIEHAEAPGEVEITQYRHGLLIMVRDEGQGFAGSLRMEDDRKALEAALVHGTSRFRDPGRGQGLKQVRSRVGRWGGTIMVISGTARIHVGVERDELFDGLSPEPGVSIEITIPPRSLSG